jgi:hypothetical protein
MARRPKQTDPTPLIHAPRGKQGVWLTQNRERPARRTYLFAEGKRLIGGWLKVK